MEVIDVYGIPGFREPFNCFTHLLGAAVFAVLSFYLVKRGRGASGRTVCLLVMALASVALLSLSSVYHMLWPGTAREVMRRLDVAAVFVLIGGTMTPIHVILFKGFHRWGPLTLVWSLAVTGIVLRMVFFSSLPPGIGTACFVLLGWGGAISAFALWRRYGWTFVKPLVFGGIAYTVGAIILLAGWPVLIPGVIGSHELWHLAVLAGLGFHWRFVWSFASFAMPVTELVQRERPCHREREPCNPLNL
jgi:channel protein (hemolysin III family)